MDKFAHEKNRRKEIAKKQGVDPIWVGIRKNDEYIGRETRVNFVRPIKLNSVKTSAASVHEKIATAAERINEDYIQKIINSTNSFPTAFMAVKENRDLVRKLRAAKFKNPVIDKDKIISIKISIHCRNLPRRFMLSCFSLIPKRVLELYLKI